MHPRTAILLSVVGAAMVGGCVQDPAPAPSTSEFAAAPLAGDARFGFVGESQTREPWIVVFANVTGTVNLRVLLNGTLWFQGTVRDAEQELNLSLSPGRTPVFFEAASSSARRSETLVATRLGLTRLEVDYCHFHPSTPNRKADRYEVWIDVDARPSLGEYSMASVKHPDRFTAHDQIRQWANETRIPVATSFHASQGGFAVDRIDGVGNPATSAAPPYWLLSKNGEDVGTGMTALAVRPGDSLRWRLC